MDNQQVTQLEIGWAAGIIDGEGYLGVGLGRNHKNTIGTGTVKVELFVCNTDRAIIDKYADILRRLGQKPYIRWNRAKNYSKEIGKVVVHRMAPLLQLLRMFDPYLTGAKKVRSGLILEFLESRVGKSIKIPGTALPYTDREAEIIAQCFKLQKRGTSETIRKGEIAAHQLRAGNTIEKKCEIARKILKLHEEGKSQRQIAIALGYHPNSGAKIGWWIRKLKGNQSPIQKLGFFPQYSDDIVQLYAKA